MTNKPGDHLYVEKEQDISQLNSETEKEEETFKISEFIRAIAIAVLAALLIKAFFFEAYRIPTGSMENTLLAGDFIIVNKAAYGLSTPKTIPIINVDMPQAKLLSYNEPKRNDVIVFKFPGYKNELFPSTDASYIKRIVGLPGDTILIVDKTLYVNGKKVDLPGSGKIGSSSFRRKGFVEQRIFPDKHGWNRDNYGPLIVPRKGETIPINPVNAAEWKTIIDREFEKRTLSEEGSVITIEGKPVKSYTFRKNYYFVLGDNRDDSMDSRYWGFVPEDLINGKALLVYWSWDPFESSGFFEFFRAIRFHRLLKLID